MKFISAKSILRYCIGHHNHLLSDYICWEECHRSNLTRASYDQMGLRECSLHLGGRHSLHQKHRYLRRDFHIKFRQRNASAEFKGQAIRPCSYGAKKGSTAIFATSWQLFFLNYLTLLILDYLTLYNCKLCMNPTYTSGGYRFLNIYQAKRRVLTIHPVDSSQSKNLNVSLPISPMPYGPGNEVGCRMIPTIQISIATVLTVSTKTHASMCLLILTATEQMKEARHEKFYPKNQWDLYRAIVTQAFRNLLHTAEDTSVCCKR